MLRRLATAAPRRLLKRQPAVRAVASGPAARAGTTSDGSGAAFAGLGLAAAGAALLGFGMSPLRCDAGQEYDVKFTTYNVLAPRLCSASHFPKCPPGTTEHEQRLPKIMARLEQETATGAVVGLQEVDLLWAGKLHTYFAEKDYVAVFAQYGNPFNNYMGVMMAWPRDKYEALDVEISKISETAPPGTWPKGGKDSSVLTPFGYLTYNGMKEVLGCPPPEPVKDNSNFEWDLAKSRNNEAVFVRLRPRGQPDQPSFCVATYHMPCLFGPPEKVRVVNIHTYLLLSRLKAFAGSDPAVLMGDFNFKPGDTPYLLAQSGGAFEAAAPSNPEELKGLKDRLKAKAPWPSGLKSAYQDFNKKEPLFTNFAQTNGQDAPFIETLDYIWFSPNGLSVVDCPKLPLTKEEVSGPFPNVQEPSDHLPLRATLRVTSPMLQSRL
mmetsp:Transcript_61607/g.156589  ORF Transcript_61607/g.156589 Transcript_61607/m.156589 type:complete len:435 (+) Transcript_61607:66-1370(+)